MSRSDFRGNVGQAVVGSVNEGPRLNNVVNLTLAEAQVEKKCITRFQRRKINELVKQWAAISGKADLDIYSVFMTDYGLNYFKELPIERYGEVKAQLERWIRNANQPPAPAAASAAPLTPIPSQDKAATSLTTQRKHITHLRRMLLIAVATAAITTVTAGYLIFQRDIANKDAPVSYCLYEGKTYSAGSIIRNAAGAMVECRENMIKPASWIAVKKWR